MAIAFVNATSGGNNTGAGTASIACTAAAHTAGNLIVVGVAYTSGSAAVSSITDTAGNTYTLVPNARLSTGGLVVDIYYRANCLGNATNVVTVNYSPSVTFPRVCVHSYSGVALSTPLDVVSTGHTASGSSVATGNLVTTMANEVIFAFMSAANTSTWVAGASYNLRGSVIQGDSQGEDRIVSATGTYTASGTITGPLEMWITAASFSDTDISTGIVKPFNPVPFMANGRI